MKEHVLPRNGLQADSYSALRRKITTLLLHSKQISHFFASKKKKKK